MSRVGKQPVPVPAGVEVKTQDGAVAVKGPKGALQFKLPGALRVAVAEGKVVVQTAAPDAGALQGMARSMIANMIAGVTRGYSKDLEIQGVGFKAAVQGRQATFALGSSSPVVMAIPDGIEIKVTDGVNLTVSGADKQQVGDVSARIKDFYPAEPYKGKGIRFKGEYVRRKAGKTVA